MMDEFQGETVTTVEKFTAPYNKEIEVQQVSYENGFSMLRLRIREGKRFTMIDLDPPTAALWGNILRAWADQQIAKGQG